MTSDSVQRLAIIVVVGFVLVAVNGLRLSVMELHESVLTFHQSFNDWRHHELDKEMELFAP
jgi:hypothetical protein